MKKKRIFIGSSTQSKGIAKQIARTLEGCGAKVKCWWDTGIFIAGRFTWETLMTIVNNYDGAVFVLGEDDVINNGEKSDKNKPLYMARDNVLIEAGLFYGVLGKEGVALYQPEGVKTATDWLGLTTIRTRMEEQQTLTEGFEAWLKEVKFRHNKKPHNVHMESRADINDLYPITERFGLLDDKFSDKIVQVRILNFASNLLVGAGADPRHPKLPDVIRLLLKKERPASIELILAEPTEAVLNDVQTKITNSSVGPQGAIYSAQSKIYELLTTDPTFMEAKREGYFSYYVTNISIPFAIFNVEFDGIYSDLNHVRIDLYSAKLPREEERRSMIIWQKQDKENYKFFVDNFNSIRQDTNICHKPTKEELKKWSDIWSKMKGEL